MMVALLMTIGDGTKHTTLSHITIQSKDPASMRANVRFGKARKRACNKQGTKDLDVGNTSSLRQSLLRSHRQLSAYSGGK